MKFIKHFVRLNLLLLSSIILISCGGSSSSPSPGSNTPTETEPNDSFDNATAITVGDATLEATIGNGGVDTDYFSFVVDTTGVQYTINPSVGCDIDQQVWLYDTDGVTPLINAQDDDNGFGPNNSEANCETIIYTFTTAGTYFLRVEELSQSAEGIYGVEITRFIIDEAEPNDTFGTAEAITVGAASFGASIGNGGVDTDYFSFVVDTAGALYTINPSVECNIDQQVWLYDTDGVTALVDAQDDDNGIGPNNPEPNCETIFYTFTTAGTYFLRVEELGQSSEGIYGVEITRFISDEAEPNDSFGTAEAITIDAATFSASIGNGGVDTDYFSFVVDTTGVEYTINPSVECNIDQQVWLYDTDGVTALVDAQDNDNGIGPNNPEANCETIFYTFTTAGTYFLRVEELSQSAEGIYGVEISISAP